MLGNCPSLWAYFQTEPLPKRGIFASVTPQPDNLTDYIPLGREVLFLTITWILCVFTGSVVTSSCIVCVFTGSVVTSSCIVCVFTGSVVTSSCIVCVFTGSSVTSIWITRAFTNCFLALRFAMAFSFSELAGSTLHS